MNLANVPLISAASHVEEPADLWVRELPPRMLDDLPDALRPELGRSVLLSDRRRAGAADAEDFGAAVSALRDSGLGSVLDASTNLEWRLDAMRRDGISGECVYPTMGLFVWSTDDPAVGEACCRIYNDWIFEGLESRSPRFRCAGMIPTWDVAAAVREVRRIADLGLAGAMLPMVAGTDYNHRLWAPLWSEIEESGLPVVMHQGTGHDMLFYRGPGAAVANLVATQSLAPRTASLLATSGVLASHPGLHFVFVETNASWLAWAMDTVDYYHEAFQKLDGWVRPVLDEPPSRYLARQIHGTFQFDPVAVESVGKTGVEPLLWGSAFPHAESTYPNSRSVVVEQFEDIDFEEATEIVNGNAARLFHFDPRILFASP